MVQHPLIDLIFIFKIGPKLEAWFLLEGWTLHWKPKITCMGDYEIKPLIYITIT